MKFKNTAALWAVLGCLILGTGYAASTAMAGHAINTVVQTISGNSGAGNPPCPPADNGQVQACVTSLTFTGVVLGGNASSSDIDTGKVTILADDTVPGTVKVTKRLSPKGCHWTKGGFWNSGWGADGKRYTFWDSVPGELCPAKSSPTGWVKVAGGTTGRHCKNPASEKRQPPFSVVVGRVLLVRTFANLKMHLHATAHVVLNAICGKAEASGFADIVVNVQEFIRTRGNLQGRLKMGGGAVGKAVAKAQANIHCETPTPGPTTTVVVTTPAPPPVTTTTQTTTTQTTTTTITTTPVQHSCSLNVALASKSDPYTANATVNGDVAPSSTTFDWGNGTTTGGTSQSHTYPAPPPSSTAGTGITYVISATAHFANGQNVNCGSVQFFVPAPPPSGNTAPPPPPGG